MIRVVVSGAGGRMGKLLLQAVIEEDDMELAGAVERKDHPLLNRDVGELTGSAKCRILLNGDLKKVISSGDILVEFSTPQATLSHLPLAVEKNIRIVIGTTGLNDEEKERIKESSSKIPIILSPNMSIGVNLLFKIAGEVARILGAEYDVEIVETHHRMKKDAPSGTALRLAEVIAQARGQGTPTTRPPSRGRIKEAGQGLKGVVVYGRHGITGERETGAIGIHSVRGGTVSGEHTVIFAGASERVELTHRAESRQVFVRGAIEAIRFIAGASPGLYDMQDVIASQKG